MSMPHRPDFLLNLYLIKLGATDVIVVRVELGLEADGQSALCSCQRILDSWPAVVDAGQEGVSLGDDRIDAGKRAICTVQLRGQQVTRQTANCILILGAAAVHGCKDLSGSQDVAHRVGAKGLWQILLGPRTVTATTCTTGKTLLAIWVRP